jgi:ferredoxin-type protein NapH
MPLIEAPRIIGLLYAVVIVFFVPFLLFRSRFYLPVRAGLACLAVLSGFLLFSPMTPVMFMVFLYHLKEFSASLVLVAGVFLFFIGSAALFGRSFCAYGCPLGAAQELPYFIPAWKWILKQSTLLLVIRGLLVTGLALLAFLAIANLLFTSLILLGGARDVFLFSEVTLPSILFLVLIGISAVLYRPFCRFACPYGAIMSIAAWKSILRVKRTSLCTGCGACEKVCPTGEANPQRRGNECYLCGRCLDVCPAKGAIGYMKRGEE